MDANQSLAGALSHDEIMRYSRHLLMPEVGLEGQQRLKGASVLIIGTGGLAPLFSQGDLIFDSVEEDLTMHGLTVIHAFNKENGDA